MINITLSTEHYDVTIELPLVEQPVIEAVLDAVVKFVQQLNGLIK
jgi:hypothetical protein